MDIEKLKAEFEQSECFKKLEHVAQYTFFEFGAYLKRTDVPDNVEKKCGHLITALIFSWGAWKEAKARAVPETQQALNDRLLVKSIREHVESHIAEISVNDLFDKGWFAAMKCIKNNIDMLEAQEPANE
ncbi:hypothetical protein WCE01_01605 [Acinetobacter indicus]|uniref:hypothetical protein n=1 Tax=Acinetobacter indicus TaxID=756892 RepID=UPI0034D6B092